jgi:hypothetical protein
VEYCLIPNTSTINTPLLSTLLLLFLLLFSFSLSIVACAKPSLLHSLSVAFKNPIIKELTTYSIIQILNFLPCYTCKYTKRNDDLSYICTYWVVVWASDIATYVDVLLQVLSWLKHVLGGGCVYNVHHYLGAIYM